MEWDIGTACPVPAGRTDPAVPEQDGLRDKSQMKEKRPHGISFAGLSEQDQAKREKQFRKILSGSQYAEWLKMESEHAGKAFHERFRPGFRSGQRRP